MEKIQEALTDRALGQTEEDVLRNLGYTRKIDEAVETISDGKRKDWKDDVVAYWPV